MRRVAAKQFLVILAVAIAGCNVDKLVDPAPTRVLEVAPATAVMHAPAGSAAAESLPLTLRSARAGAIAWTLHQTSAPHWLGASHDSGSTPDTLVLTFDPTGLAAGTYRDTLSFEPTDPDLATTTVPVSFVIGSCEAAHLALDATVTDSLRESDCGSSHRAGAFGRRYSFSGSAGDSVTFALTSTAFAGYLVVDTSADLDAPALAESGSCAVTGVDACLRYLRLPRSGTYTVEVTTTGSGAKTGAFTLDVGRPRAPTLVEPLGQFRIDSTTAIPVGGVTPETAFLIRGASRDADVGDSATLEVEVRSVDSAFTGVATTHGAVHAAPGSADAVAEHLRDGVSYHWQARLVDETGRRSAWRSFGGNGEGSADLKVTIAADRLSFQQQPTTTTAGAAITPAVTVVAVDNDGHPVTGFTGTVTLTLSGGTSGASLSGDRSVSAVAGVATFSGLSVDRVGTGYLLTAASADLVSTTSAQFAITAAAATHLVFTQQPTTTNPSRSISPPVVVTALDAQGNVATSFTGAVTIALAHDGSVLKNAKLSGTLSVAAAAGRATFSDLKLDQLGTGYTLSAAAAGLTGVTSSGFDILPVAGAATQQAFTTQPSAVSAGSAITPPVAVTIYDGLGGVVKTFTGPVTLQLTGGTANALLSGTTTESAVGGVAQFADLHVDLQGTGYRLLAKTADLPNATSNTFAVGPPPPGPGTLTVTTATTGTSPDPDGYTVSVGSSARTIGVNGSTTYTGLSPGTTTVALSGIAGNCHVDGDNPRDVTVLPDASVETAFAVVCATTPPPTGAIAVTVATAGSDQDPDGYTVTVGGTARSIPDNGTVTFASLAPGSYSVGLGGLAANCTVSGANPRDVSIAAGETGTTTFNVNCPGPTQTATQLQFAQQPPAVTVVGGAFGATVEVLDGSGARVTGYSGPVTMTLAGGLIGSSLSGTTAVNAVGGVARFTDLHVTGPCVGCRLMASASSLTSAVSDPFTVVVP